MHLLGIYFMLSLVRTMLGQIGHAGCQEESRPRGCCACFSHLILVDWLPCWLKLPEPAAALWPSQAKEGWVGASQTPRKRGCSEGLTQPHRGERWNTPAYPVFTQSFLTEARDRMSLPGFAAARDRSACPHSARPPSLVGTCCSGLSGQTGSPSWRGERPRQASPFSRAFLPPSIYPRTQSIWT